MLRSLRPRFDVAPAAGVTMPVRRWPERRAVVLTVAVALFAAILALRAGTADVENGVGLLLVIPTALVALELGLVAGVAAAAVATGLIVSWSAVSGADLGVEGLATRAGVFVLVGALAGRFSDRMRDAAVRQQRLMASGLALAHLGDAAETPRILAEWARATVGAKGARVELLDRRAAHDGTVGDDPLRIPIEARGERLGELAVELQGPPRPEDEAVLATLAAQAGIAADNQRLLASARDQAVLEAQLSTRSNQLREVLVEQEDERRQLALHLHEDVAQAMAAILLGLGALERDIDSDAVRPRLELLRSHVDATLVDLRNLAVSVRPPVLDLGLDVALERLGEQYGARGLERMDVSLDDALAGQTADGETALYRVVEEALDAYDKPLRAAVTAGDAEFAVTVEGGEGAHLRPERIAIVGARVELLGGTLHANGDLRLRIPLDRTA